MAMIASNPVQRAPSTLPKTLANALAAVNEPEVIAAMKLLAQHGLGVCLPHMHSATRDFDELPTGMVQVERNQRVTFEAADTLAAAEFIPVAWRYEEANGVMRIAECGCCHFDPATQTHNRP